ncbi:MAG: peptidylprolyl isomerase [Saprospiraceae bacterium]
MRECHNSWSCKLWPYLVVAAWVALALGACVPVSETTDPSTQVVVDFNDPMHRHLYDMQDRLMVDSLLPFLEASDVSQRYLAAQAFASIDSDSAVGPLTRLLLDPVNEVRAMAAYALGQQGKAAGQFALLQAFDFRDTIGVYKESNAAILEAIGKVGDTTMLSALSNISTYTPTDTALLLGQSRGLYRFATRGKVNPLGTATMLRYATSLEWPESVRVIAANYLKRSKIDLSGNLELLAQAIAEDPSSEVRMALSHALGKTQEASTAIQIAILYRAEKNQLVRLELLNAMGKQPYESGRALLLAATSDPNDLIAETAANQLRKIGIGEDASQYWRIARDSITGAAKYPMYAAALKHMPPYLTEYRKYIRYELKNRFVASENRYEKADILRTLAVDPWNYRYIVDRALVETDKVVRSGAGEGILSMASRADIQQYFRASFPVFKKEIGLYIKQVMEGDNAGLQALAANTLSISKLNFQTAYVSLGFLDATQKRLDLPRDTETYYAIEDAKEVMKPNYTAEKPVPAFNHPINWDIYRSLQPGLEAVVETGRGEIVIDFFEQETPGTVVNFVQLIRNGYYNGKGFHRIVPNFVTQGGCNRGDGYGSLDYTIRSETPPLYYDGAGYVGMASAGNHTEGVQFFFTHSPTPHLDGRYTIFGRVSEGMDVVLALQRGDEMRMRLQ